MKLNLNKTLRAALIAAITAVGFTLPQSFATTTEATILTLPASVAQIQPTPTGWNQSIGAQTSITGAAVANDLKVCPALATDGWHWALANAQNNCNTDFSVTPDTQSFQFKGRQGYGGEFVAGTVDVETLLSSASAAEVTQLTFNFAKGSPSQGDLTFSAWYWDGESATATALVSANSSLPTTATDYTWTAEDSGLTTGKILIVFSESSAAQTNTINNFSATATLSTSVEPVVSLTWAGTEQDHELTSSVWDDGQSKTAEYSSTAPLIFNADGYTTVAISSDATAKSIEVEADDYTIDAVAGTLSMQKLTVDEGATLTLKGTVAVSGSVTVADEHSLVVSEGAVLKVAGESAAKTLLSGSGVDNSGTVELGSNVTIDDSLTSKLGGTVRVADGKKLTLGTTKDSHSIDLTSLDALVLGQGANIDTKALKVDIKNLTANGSTLNMLDTKDKNQVGVDLKGTTKLEGNLTITSGWKYKVNIEKLVGSGSLELTGGNEEHRAVIGDVAINSLTVTNKMNNVDLTGTVALSGVLGVNGTTNVTGQNAMTVGGLTGSATLNVANGITFNVAEGGNYSYTGTLTVGGQIVKQGDGTQTISGTALKHTVLAQAGTLVLNGDYAIDDIAESEIVNTTVDYEGNESYNGFHKSSGTIIVYSGEGTLNLDAAHFKYATGDVTDDVKAGDGKFTLSEVTDKSIVYVTKDSLDIANYKTDALTTVELSDGTTVNMDTAITVGVKLAEGTTATVSADEATTISSISGTGAKLIVTGDDIVTLASASTMTTAVEIGGTATVKLGNVNALGNTSGVTVLTGATLDVNGTKDQNTCIAVTLAGGTLTNTGNEASFGSKQLIKDLVVTQDSTVDAAANDFGVINGGYNTTTLTLDATLEKVGSHDFHLANTTVTGDGAIKVTEGAVWFGRADSAAIGSYASDFIMNGGDIKGRLSLDADISVTTEAGGSTFSANVTNNGHTITYAGDYDLTVSGAISGDGGIVKNGEGTLTLSGTNTYTGTTMVNGGTLDIQGSIANSTVKVADDATLAGNTENISVGIASGKTATIAGDFTPKDSGVTFYSDSTGVEVKNIGDAEITYGIDQEGAKVTADRLGVESGTAVTVKNEVVVWGIANFGKGDLTLTHVNVERLESVNAYDGALTLQNITKVSLDEIEIASGSTVAVYKGDVADATQEEGTVIIMEKLKAGGGTLLANLEMANGSKLALSLEGGGMQALTLGSQFTIAEGAHVRLDDATLAALDNLAVGGSLTLIKALDQTTLGYGQDYAGTWYDAMFSRVDNEYSLAGDFQVFADGTGFGLTKVSNTPEPTTGTLSLLALAALAARRRRK